MHPALNNIKSQMGGNSSIHLLESWLPTTRQEVNNIFKISDIYNENRKLRERFRPTIIKNTLTCKRIPVACIII